MLAKQYEQNHTPKSSQLKVKQRALSNNFSEDRGGFREWTLNMDMTKQGQPLPRIPLSSQTPAVSSTGHCSVFWSTPVKQTSMFCSSFPLEVSVGRFHVNVTLSCSEAALSLWQKMLVILRSAAQDGSVVF